MRLREELIKYTIRQLSVDDETSVNMVDSYLASRNIESEFIIHQVNTLSKVLDKTLKTFDSFEEKMDFILDVCNGYKDELIKNK